MPYLIGTDEAGYGPNLGPLVISATVWRVAEPPAEVDLYERLAEVISPAPDKSRLAMADSKVLYKPGGDVRQLERGLLAALGVCGGVPCDWPQIWDALGADAAGHRHRLPWHAGYQLRLPVACDPAELDAKREQLAAVLARRQITLVAVASRAIFPQQFNELVARHGGKGVALSIATLQLLADLISELAPEPVLAICDKHGGRNFYQSLLQAVMTDRLVEICREGRSESIYRWGPPSARVEVRFRAKAEAYLPAALASMACKYLRELSMRAFNDYWIGHIPNLRPTAGYPVDAKRFKAAIAARQQELGIEDEVLWRNR